MRYELYQYYANDELDRTHPSSQQLANGVVVIGPPNVRFIDRATCALTGVIESAVETPGRSVDLFYDRNGSFQYLGKATVVAFGHASTLSPYEVQFSLSIPLPRYLWLELQAQVLGAIDVERILGRLNGEATEMDRISVMCEFVKEWYGISVPLEFGPSSHLPRSLLVFYRLLSATPRIELRNRLLTPSELVSVQGRTVFYRETQGACEWSYEGSKESAPDPPVWFRHNESRARWKLDSHWMSEFVIKLILLETILMSEFGASVSWLESDACRTLTDRFSALQISPLLFGPTTFFARNGTLLAVMKNGNRDFSAIVAARHANELTHIEDLVDDKWDRIAF